jgi:two-component system, chemotaxis family, response regulator Rcp1
MQAMERMTRPLEILLVEDNPGDVRLTREALKDWGHPTRLTVAADGVQALEALRHDPAEGQLPDMILLDLNLPRLGGREVLHAIKSSSTLRHIPVIILSSSDDGDDVQAAYDLQANCYVVKPVDLDRYLEAICGIEDFWVRLARIPDGRPM